MIRIGIGGWSFEPWRGSFYPEGLAHNKELAFASRAVTSIEINSTFYRTQTPASFKQWAAETPQDFVFSVKAPRAAVMRKDLAGAGAAIERFLASGLAELGPKLGPILWQLPPTKKFDAKDLAGFLELLPKQLGKLRLRHAIEARHPSFVGGEFGALLQAHNVAIVHVESDKHPVFTDRTCEFSYARLQLSDANEPAGYSKKALKDWAKRAQDWAKSGDVFIYFISGAKERNPAAAQALLALLAQQQ